MTPQKIEKVNEQIALESRGHFLVGMERTEAFFIPVPIYSDAYLRPVSTRTTRRSLACSDQKDVEKIEMCFFKESWQVECVRMTPESEVYRVVKKAGVVHVTSMRLGGDVDGLMNEMQN